MRVHKTKYIFILTVLLFATIALELLLGAAKIPWQCLLLPENRPILIMRISGLSQLYLQAAAWQFQALPSRQSCIILLLNRIYWAHQAALPWLLWLQLFWVSLTFSCLYLHLSAQWQAS